MQLQAGRRNNYYKCVPCALPFLSEWRLNSARSQEAQGSVSGRRRFSCVFACRLGCESLTVPVSQSPRLARTHCQNTYRALIPVYLALRNTARAPRKGWCVPKGGSARLRWNPDSSTRADVRKILLLPQRVQEPLGRLRLQAQPVQHAGLPLFCRWGASHPDSGCRAERGLTVGRRGSATRTCACT